MVQLVPGQHIHLIGIGGFGMSAIARVLLQQGFYVTGSDDRLNDLTRALEREGAIIHQGRDAAHIGGAEIVIISSAVSREHEEVISAFAQGIPVYKRQDMLEAIMRGYEGIAVAGTHGKTTTTAMITHILLETGKSPSYIVGGVMANTGTNAAMGDGTAFVIEADEYDNAFHGLRPKIEVLTSVEFDHPDFFHSPAQMVESFSYFIGLLPNDGLLIACDDDPTAQIFARNRQIVDLPVETYGIRSITADWRAVELKMYPEETQFWVQYDGQRMGEVHLQVPGRHNVLNALAALAVVHHQGAAFGEAAAALRTYQGTGRRFELRADHAGIAIIDDYAHHPTAIRLTIEAALTRYPDRDLWVVWQPHTYHRTQALYYELLHAFDAAPHLIMTEIYVARETPIPGLSAAELAKAMPHPDVTHAPDFAAAVHALLERVRPPAVVLILSAGDAPQIGIDLLAALQARPA